MDNLLTGNSSHNDLYADDGNETLNGALGDDNLYGGNGNDRYLFMKGDGADVVSDGADTLVFDGTIGLATIAMFQAGNGDVQIVLVI